ncbi:MAG TPA: hypothetical protein DCG19_02365 [Cryomorphaceae bacterium]|nr:hypothetical protein [Cryomorphaceae bacterium]HBF19875.1 hypothetical protein [Cryomorphaceae bacterium]HCQ17084.1 hypothetical protein [Cryomorphaceae bacterium]|tara:strand:- start:252 stop:941 length:690 start_codon:yes stop_codon:yes gene_type:complete
MKPIANIYLRSFLLTLFACSFYTSAGQLIDSSHVSIRQDQPDEVYVKFRALSGSRKLIRIESSLQNNTAVLNYIFKDCSSAAFEWYFDTIVDLDQLNPGSGYNVLVTSYLDTNTVDMNCFMRATYEYVDSVYYPASAIFIGQPEKLVAQNLFTVYPNPVRSYFKLEGISPNTPKVKDVFLYGSRGELIRSWLVPGKTVYETEGIAPGIYTVRVQLYDDSSHILRLMISE